MDLDYDHKFEEMKKYIPFLESMIKRLETTNNGVNNPRKAQLDKIRSLRDLLLDKKKRMKMENLLKCEQVLVNLYAKVEQRDSMADCKDDCSDKNQTEQNELNVVRSKLKSVASKLEDEDPETLPEIARATNTEVVCTPGSKEPALFQRRPNKASPNSCNDDTISNSKRHYTRVLMSPEHKKNEWPGNSNTNIDKPLFSRRSPRSPRRYSPSYKKERKKSSKQRSKSSQHSQDLNITLKVPQESLGSLNTKDILSRIINCSDNDVDIDTLRGLRSQILGELKQTGAKDDISDLILKSYKQKDKQISKKDEVEEGELSDSESEAIENIYGSLVVISDDEDNSNTNKTPNDKKNPRKIQICLVINSDKEKDNKISQQKLNTTLDVTDFEAYTAAKSADETTSDKPEDSASETTIRKEMNIQTQEIQIKSPSKEFEGNYKSPRESPIKTGINEINKEKVHNKSPPKTILTSVETFKPNFYQSYKDENMKAEEELLKIQTSSQASNENIGFKNDEFTNKPIEITKNSPTSECSDNVLIKKDAVSEIDILQALKNEILGETPTAVISEAATPPLHQPKVTKVASALEIMPKKRISIEKYKQKSVPSSVTQPLFNPVKRHSSLKDDNSKKQSLKLTEKECERFNFPVDVSPVDSSDDEEMSSIDFEFLNAKSANIDVAKVENSVDKSKMEIPCLHTNSAPKSPDHEDFADTGIKPPVIIPSDPIKNVVPSKKTDIDMRTLMPLSSPVTLDGSKKSMTSPLVTIDNRIEGTRNEKAASDEKSRKSISENRLRYEPNQSLVSDSPNSQLVDTERQPRPSAVNLGPNMAALMSLTVPHMTPTLSPNMMSSMNPIITPILNPNIPLLLNPNMPPNMLPTMIPGLTPNMIPNMNNPTMTPTRMMPNINPMMTPILTPNARSYEMTPRPNFDNDDYTSQKHVYAPIFPTFEPHDFMEKDALNMQANLTNESPKWEDRNDRYKGDQRLESPQIRMECPSTPNPSFGRMDCPPTPNPSFGRLECPSTPNPSFGRMETPMTPIHSFGRSDCPMTPSHSYGRCDPSMSPHENAFGRSEYHHNTSNFNHKYMKAHDPRLNRSFDYDKYQCRNEERNRSYFEDECNINDNTNRYRRSQVKSYEKNSRNSRDSLPSRRESSMGRTLSRDYDAEKSYGKDFSNSDYAYRREKYKCFGEGNRRRDYSPRNVGRMNSSEDTFTAQKEKAKRYTREGSIEKLISVQSHTGRSFNVDTSFNRTFQDIESTKKSFDARRRRASSVGRSLRESPYKDLKRTSTIDQNEFESVIPDRKTLQFRRACSVGRDLKDYDVNKNFNDIKEDLRSCKFNNFNFNLGNSVQKSSKQTIYTIEKVSFNEHNSRQDRCIEYSTSSKTMEHQMNRDSRRRARDDYQTIYKMHDNSKYSARKNYRDPRMRREIDVRTASKDNFKEKDKSYGTSHHKNYGIVYSNDNIAKGTILASAAGVKNFKIPKIKRATEESEVENTIKQCESDKKEISLKNTKKADNVNIEHLKKGENKQGRSAIISVDKHRSSEIDKKNVDTSNSKEDAISSLKMTDTDKNCEKVDSVNLLTDSCDRRITRSAIRASKQIPKISPVRKLRRIKKPLVSSDSDSESQESDSNGVNVKKNESKNIETINDSEKNDEKVAVKSELNPESSKNMKEADNAKYVESENVTIIESTDEKNTLAKKESVVTPLTKNVLCEEHNDSLDISFGVDDELFSDTIASESVLDNINALIADLDHDIEAPKINDKFINNIVGNISSNESVELNENKPDFAADALLKDNISSVIDGQVLPKCSSQLKEEITFKEDEVTQINNNRDIINKPVTQSECSLHVHNGTKEMMNSKTESTVILITENAAKAIEEHPVENLNIDAVVSTTANDGKIEVVSKLPQTSLINDSVNSPSIPDSTIHLLETNTNISTKEYEESARLPDSTNELSDDTSSKHQCSSNLICTDNLPGIGSIGTLLSILEDKKKIKELLAMLGKDSGENEKIKKKLEKLSEIVSDDEEDLCEPSKDTARILNYDNKLVGDMKIDDEQSNKGKPIVAESGQNIDVPLKNTEAAIYSGNEINENKVDVNVKEQKDTDNNEDLARERVLPSNNLIKNKTVTENINTTMDATRICNESIELDKNDIHVENNTEQESKEQATNTNNIENQTETSTSVHHNTGKITKKPKVTKKGKSKIAKKVSINKDKRITRSEAGTSQPQMPTGPKKPSRELMKLQEDIRDMFISEDILNVTGIRMCRLAKLVDDKRINTQSNECEPPEPIVVLENINRKMTSDESLNSIEKINKKKMSKNKPNSQCGESVETESKEKTKHRPGPKSKTQRQEDPYTFETDSLGDSNNTIDSRDQNTDSESDSTSTKSFGSSDLPMELKKKTKRKRRSWQLGVIKKKGMKNKSVMKSNESSISKTVELGLEEEDKTMDPIPDLNCFTDKTYCFYKNVKNYLCRLCGYRGADIVPHYKKHHPHSEIPLSRLSPATAKDAIEECENKNLQAISKIQTMKYVCRFCFHEFQKNNTALETFFWHVVSMHTGEYKQLCSECINVTRCPFHLDIPPPPKNLKGQLIGFICGRCNFTQVSLENLKTHVIIRHDDEETEVYTINLGEISKKVLQSLITQTSEPSIEVPRVLRSTRSNNTEYSDDRSDITDSLDRIIRPDTVQDKLLQEINSNASPKITSVNKIQSKLIFENDDFSDTSSYSKSDEIIKATIKLERDEDIQNAPNDDGVSENAVETPLEAEEPPTNNVKSNNVQDYSKPSSDVLDFPHFKIKLSNTGSKEYVCCINGVDNHYTTTLLISFKKHVQLKHPENWDGYCFVCKVIVTGQGKHTFKDCLQHFLDKHIDNFPILENTSHPMLDDVAEPTTSTPLNDPLVSKTYINVRPFSELVSSSQSETSEVNSSMPKIQNVVSLGGLSDTHNSEPKKDEAKCYNYEEAQAEVMRQKHRVVLEAMLTPEKLMQVFKCAGRFCSYTTDNAEEALLHASTHQKIGGENSLKCAYCDFDPSGNAIDLVMHIFKSYSHCTYACSKCFYRAAVSQLVYGHIKRVHSEVEADKVPILSTPTVVKDNTKDDLMSRDAAVLYYICNNQDTDLGGVCQFKSYVLTKFREHLQTKHTNDQEYSCYMCNVTTPSSKLLAQHLKSHGLRIYQCCRCLFGADNEIELMAHASEKHPLKQPKAYLRIITSKGGSSEVRVLPLAVLSKSSVETTIVLPTSDKESPVKQAERSIDLEKLIGHTNLMIDSMTDTATNEPVDTAPDETQIQLESEETSCLTIQVEAETTPSAILTLLENSQDSSNAPNASVKSEPVEMVTSVKGKEVEEVPSVVVTPVPLDPEVVCLDSDDESSRPSVIDLSGDDTPVETISVGVQEEVTYVKVPRSRLYKCFKCCVLSKSEGMFKRHLISCYTDQSELIKCEYCPHVTSVKKMVVHYNSSHLENTVPYSCAICDGKFVSLIFAKKHMKLVHNEISTVVKTKSTNGFLHYIIDSDVKERITLKRKLSGDNVKKTSEPAPKIKKYGPMDVDKLPINPILDNLVFCSLCEFNTKVRLNMVRHLQLHAEQQPVPRTAPVNPVPHLESNEKHFDKMVNLASSSITNTSKASKDGPVSAAEHLSPEAAAIYPKYVSDRQRYTCGAKDCSYISVNESMLKIHWETLHAGTNDYHCVHCPPHQHLDTSKTITAARIIGHLKMHDNKLYGCSSCTYYHHTRKLVDKHLKEVHKGKLLVIREDGASLPPAPPAVVQVPTPTMDLKPWQCGLCKFKSMLCPEVIEHCGKHHQSKMQFKCTYCSFRTSNIENISNHHSNLHPGKTEEVFYFYYREGSIPDDPDGTPRWQRQVQRSEPEIKIETDIPPLEPVPVLSNPSPSNTLNPVNLDIVKKEVVEPEGIVSSEKAIGDLIVRFGELCEPNGLSYKCPMCHVVYEATKEAMQSHMFEELQYRKWGCGICSYRAFHKPGLQQHVDAEHGNNIPTNDPVELQLDQGTEAWVTLLLDHQSVIIQRNKDNLAKQKAEILRATPGSTPKVAEKPVEQPKKGPKPVTMTMAGLEKLFGPFGVPSNMNYTCPKCNTSARSELVMQEHLENELNKIRWYCSNCSETFQTYHEAQFHCRSVHPGQSSRPMEATRNGTLRAAWVAAVLHVQKLSMNYMPVTETKTDVHVTAKPTPSILDNSLLVIRYEEKVPTPEELMKLKKKSVSEDKVNTEDVEKKKQQDFFQCQFCNATYKGESFFHSHVLKHYGLKPYTCPYCPYNDQKKFMESHIITEHPNRSIAYVNTKIPTTPPVQDCWKSTPSTSKSLAIEADTVIICLVCEEAMTKAKSQTHFHDDVKPQFGIKGSMVYRCWSCLTLHKSSSDYNLHFKQFHSTEKKRPSYYKLHDDTRSLFCSICKQHFPTMTQYRSHHQTSHGLKYVIMQPEASAVVDMKDAVETGCKRKVDGARILPAAKRVAKKSTTKLPHVMAVARKSTTKLPFDAPCVEEEYSYYGTKPSLDNLENVSTLMPFCNTVVPFSLTKLSEIIKIHPVVVVKDINVKVIVDPEASK